MEEYRLELYHHGIKGMKWGKRLYQRKDGSLTALGRLRYGKKGNADSRAKTAETVESKKQKVLASRSAKALDKNAHLFDDQELSRAYQRLALEKKIRELEPPPKSKMESLTNKTNKAADLLSSGTKFYNSFAKIKNAFSKNGKPWPLIGEGGKKDDGDNDGGNKKNKDDKKNKDTKDDKKDNKTSNPYTSPSYDDKDVSWVSPDDPFARTKNATREKSSNITTDSGNNNASYTSKTPDPYISMIPSFEDSVSFVTTVQNIERGRDFIKIIRD